MAAPTITSITPSVGLSIGETFVVIDGSGFNDEASGGTVNVYFNGVISPRFGVVDSTRVVAVTPLGQQVGVVDVSVENVTPQPDPNPDLVEPTTVVGGFEFKRPSIATRSDFTTDSCLLKVNRELLKELRRTVLSNTHHDMHPEYVDSFSVLDEEEKHSEAPSLKLLGPVVTEDRFHALNGVQSIQVIPSPGGSFDVQAQPVTVQAEYQYVGVGRSKGETMNLFAALSRYFNRTPFLAVPQDGIDPANGIVEYELQTVWEQRAEFAERATREAIYQFSGAFRVRGIHLVSDKAFEGRDVVDIVTVVEPNP